MPAFAFTEYHPLRSFIVRDDEIFHKAFVRNSVFFAYLTHGGEARPALEILPQLRQLLAGSAGENLHAAVVKITHVTAQMQFFRGMLREIAKPYTLDSSGNEVPLGLLCLAHGA